MARTIDDIKGRCRVEEDECGVEHWVWTGATDKEDGQCWVRAPDYGVDPTGAKTRVMSVRRAIYMVTKKRAPPKGWQFFKTCLVPNCVKCTSLTTKKKGGVHVSKRMLADEKTKQRLSAAALRTWDKRGRKVSDETVAEIIRQADKPNKEVAAQVGVHPTTAWQYRTGRARAGARRQALGMFSGLVR